MIPFRITTKGKIALAILALIALIMAVMGSIYFAVYMFVLLTTTLALTLYDVFINK